MSLPGMSQILGDVCADVKPSTQLQTKERPVIVLTTGTITKENLFRNGLLQNIILFYRLFEAIGFEPHLMMNELPAAGDLPDCLIGARIEDGGSLSRKCLRIHTFIEVGMSIDSPAKKQLKMMGARLMKIYLGNILNIDIETPLFYPTTCFPHHIGSGTDTILVSPHYGQNSEYAESLNRVPISSEARIAPYIWDPSLIEPIQRWRPGTQETIVIMEPNISFQKTGIVPLLAMERWYRKNRNWQGKVVLFNSDRLMTSYHFQLMYFKRFELFKDKKIEMHGRAELREALKTFPSAVFLAHQVNNEFNYMMLELFWAGFPVIHNVDSWREFGYFYSGADLDDAASRVREACKDHANHLEMYQSHAKALAWRYSLYNPAVQAAWKKRLAA